jgi:hypothetical protein
LSIAQRVFPGCPGCPPAGLSDRSHKPRVRRGFLLSPSADGGLLLFELFSPRLRSNSATPATSAAFSRRIESFCAASVALSLASIAFCAISRSILACKIATDARSPVASAGCSGTRRGETRSVSQTRLDSGRAVTCQEVISPGDLASYEEEGTGWRPSGQAQGHASRTMAASCVARAYRNPCGCMTS